MAGPEGFDVVIVGGGAAGCVLARRLAESTDRSVVLLEAGPDLAGDVAGALRDGWTNPSGADWAHDWGYVAEPDAAGATTPLRRGRLLGGTSWLTRFAVRGAAADFDAWAARGNPGWDYASLLPSFRRLETDAEFGDRSWHGDRGPLHVTRYPALPRSDIHRATIEAFERLGFAAIEDHNAPDAVGIGPMPMSSRGGQRITALDAYLPPERRPPNLEIRTNAHVAGVVIRGRHADSVRLVDGTEIAADEVVLSAGTYGSPAILLRSGVGPGDDLRALGIGVAVDLPGVGANLADHPGVDLDSGWRGEAPSGGPALHSIATFRSSSQPAWAPPDLMVWLSDPAGADPGFYLDPVLLKPASRGSVRLRSADPADPPRINLPALTEPSDVDRLGEGYRLGIEVANDPSIRRLAREPAPPMPTAAELPGLVRAGAYSLPHVVGTCRMGPAPADGDVVDARGRVHGIENLAVVDASIVPDAAAGYPHIVTIMIAEHLAGTLARALSR